MRRLLWLVLLLNASVASAQTSITCGSAGNCGNQVLHANNGDTTNNKNIWYGNALSMSAANLSVLNWYISLKSGVNPFSYILLLVCDNNLSGAVIASGGNCPANNVICNSGVKTNPSPGDNTHVASGCSNPLLTTVRYWVLMNNDTTTTKMYVTDAGGSHQTSYFIAGTCCTVPSSITGTLTATGSEFGILGLQLNQPTSNPVRRVVSF